MSDEAKTALVNIFIGVLLGAAWTASIIHFGGL